MENTKKITWLLFHEPIELFLRTAESFSKEIKRLTNNRIQIDVYTKEQYAKEFKSGSIRDPISLINSGNVQMTQLQVGYLAKWSAVDFHALDMPFIFRDYAHCDRVLEGDIGEGLLNDLKTHTPVHGLAFTFSGGYRLIAAEKPINVAEDLVGLTMVTAANPVFVDTIEAFGCKVVAINNRDDIDGKLRGDFGNAIQTTLPRYRNEANPAVHKYVTNTKHSMFLTTIVISNEFWNSLTDEDRVAMKKAALHSAKLERQWTLEDANKIATSKEEQIQLGIESYQEFPESEVIKLREAAKPTHEKYKSIFSDGLLDRISIA